MNQVKVTIYENLEEETFEVSDSLDEFDPHHTDDEAEAIDTAEGMKDHFESVGVHAEIVRL